MKNQKKILVVFKGFLLLMLVPFYFSHNSVAVALSQKKIEIPVAVMVMKQLHNETFIDKRDHHIYKQVKIGNQIWMAENLNYGTLTLDMKQDNNNLVERSYYRNDTNIGKKTGALYTWDEATCYGKDNGNKFMQGLCPEGWHLPSDSEWNTLTHYLEPGTNTPTEGWLGKNLAILLVDSLGGRLSLSLSGNAVSNWYFYLNEMGYYWSSSQYSKAAAWYRCVSRDAKGIFRGPGDTKLGMSIRCIKN